MKEKQEKMVEKLLEIVVGGLYWWKMGGESCIGWVICVNKGGWVG